MGHLLVDRLCHFMFHLLGLLFVLSVSGNLQLDRSIENVQPQQQRHMCFRIIEPTSFHFMRVIFLEITARCVFSPFQRREDIAEGAVH